jgi:holo-ACP synthase CitX
MNNSILEAREERYEYIKKISKKYPTIIILKANTPGNHKNRYSSFFLLEQFNHIIENIFQFDYKTLKKGFDGPYYVYGFLTSQSKHTKLKLIEIEKSHMLGRLIDLDLYMNSLMVSRTDFAIDLRRCMICDHIAIDCMRNKRHTVDDILNYIDHQIMTYLNTAIASIIKEAMLDELNLDTKFGLVTPTSSGSHYDMDYQMMYDSIDILIPYFIEIFNLGFQYDDELILFDKAKLIGIKAEDEMLKKTNGINTYKGLIYILGFVLLATAYIIKHNKQISNLFARIQKLSKNILKDFEKDINTTGIKAYKKFQIRGIRGEVYDGLPTIQKAQKFFNNIDVSNNKNFHHILLYFIINSEDTILLKRSQSLDAYHQIKAYAEKIDPYNKEEIEEFTAYCINHHISFGGSADLFIVFQYLNKLILFLK